MNHFARRLSALAVLSLVLLTPLLADGPRAVVNASAPLVWLTGLVVLFVALGMVLPLVLAYAQLWTAGHRPELRRRWLRRLWLFTFVGAWWYWLSHADRDIRSDGV